MIGFRHGVSYTLREMWQWGWLSLRAILSRRQIADPRGFATVTLTTYGPRQWAAMLAVDSLSRGAVRPARVVLFLDGTSYQPESLPFPLAVLARRGVEVICLDADDGSYKKLPLFAWYPDPDRMPVITIDDDVRYPAGWLHGLRLATADGGGDVLCYRARRITLDGAGAFAPYEKWEFVLGGGAGHDVLPNGAYGVLYHREALEAIRNKGVAFRGLAPNADDLWFRLCTLEKGIPARVVSDGRMVCPPVPFTEDSALWAGNVTGGGNDRKLARIAPLFDLSCLQRP